MMQDIGDTDIEDERSTTRNSNNGDARSKTLNSLESFMQAQRALFQRTQADIERLRELSRKADMNPIGTLESFIKRPSPASTDPNKLSEDPSENSLFASLNFPSLSDLKAEVRKHGKASILPAIDWRLFSGCDPTKLREMASAIREAHPTSVYPTRLPPPRPPPYIPDHDLVSSMDLTYPPPLPECSSKESDLQRLVRVQRKLIVEPALESSAAFLASFSDSDNDSCPDSAVPNGRGKLGAPRNGRKSKNKARDQNKANIRRRRSGAVSANCGLTIRPRGPGGVFVKRDAEGIIDIDTIDNGSQLYSPLLPSTPSTYSNPLQRRTSSSSICMDVDPASIDLASIAISKPSRNRRPSMRLRDGYGASSNIASEANTDMTVDIPMTTSTPPTPSTAVFQEPKPVIKLKIRLPPRKPASEPNCNKTPDENAKTRASSSTRSASRSTRSASRSISTPVDVSDPENEHEDEGEDEVTADEDDVSEDESGISLNHVKGGGKTKKTNAGENRTKKLKPATFNLPWTVEEQHLLERLLKEIPDGERRRWAQISARMEGRRTPRQVASRVQKYNLKLKKFGLDVG